MDQYVEYIQQIISENVKHDKKKNYWETLSFLNKRISNDLENYHRDINCNIILRKLLINEFIRTPNEKQYTLCRQLLKIMSNLLSEIEKELTNLNDSDKVLKLQSKLIEIKTHCTSAKLNPEYIDHILLEFEREFSTKFGVQVPTIENYTKEDRKKYRKQRVKEIIELNSITKKLSTTVYLQVNYTNGIITPFDRNKRIQLLKARTGLGKTTAVKNFINANPDIQSIIMFSAKRSYASWLKDYAKNTFNVDVSCYLSDDIKGKPYIILQAESMWRVDRSYEVVIIDEITSFLEQMDSGLHGDNLDFNRMVVVKLLQDAKQIICMDADIVPKVWEFLNEILPNEIIHMNYDISQAHHKKIIMFRDKESEKECWQLLFEFIRDGKNINICLGNKNYGDRLAVELQKLNINYAYYHKDNQLTQYLQDNTTVSDLWKRYQVVMFTSTVSIGIDFNDSHFYSQFVFGESKTNTVRELNQMMNRVRHTETETIYVYNTIRNDMYPDTYEGVHKSFYIKLNIGNKMASKLLSAKEYKLSCVDGKYIWSIIETLWTRLTIKNKLERNLSKNYFEELFDQLLVDCGYQVINYINQGNASEIPKAQLTIQAKEREVNMFDQVPILDTKELKIYQQQRNKGLANELMIKAINKTIMLQQIKPKYHNVITGEHLYFIQDNTEIIKQALIEKYLQPRQALFYELKECDLNQHDMYFLKYINIIRLCNYLGVKHSRDRTINVPRSNVELCCYKLTNSVKMITDIFQITNKPRNSYASMKALIDSMLKRWSGSILCDYKHTRSTKEITIRDYYRQLIQRLGVNKIEDVPKYMWDTYDKKARKKANIIDATNFTQEQEQAYYDYKIRPTNQQYTLQQPVDWFDNYIDEITIPLVDKCTPDNDNVYSADQLINIYSKIERQIKESYSNETVS